MVFLRMDFGCWVVGGGEVDILADFYLVLFVDMGARVMETA